MIPYFVSFRLFFFSQIASETTLIRNAVSNWQAPRVFYQKKGAVCPAPKARVRCLAAEGGQTEELKTYLREYRIPQRAINGTNRVPKAALDQTAMVSETTLFRTAVSYLQAPRVIFYEKNGAIGPASKARARSLAAEGGQRTSSKVVYESTAYRKEGSK